MLEQAVTDQGEVQVKRYEAFIQGAWHEVKPIDVYHNHVTGVKLAMVESVDGCPFVIAATKHAPPQKSQYAFVAVEQIREVA
jgi:hypothetical protein